MNNFLTTMKFDIEKFRNIPFQQRTRCVVCHAKSPEALIELPDFPMTEIYTDELVKENVGRLDQFFQFCPECGHGQLARVIDVALQYGNAFSYFFRSSESSTGRDSSDFFVRFLDKTVGSRHFKTIIELGCNDLHLLKTIRSRADKLIGIDPILKGQEEAFSEGNIRAIGDFFENVDLDEDIDLVICKDTLEHVSDPYSFCKRIVDQAHDETLFFFQFPLLETLLAGCRFDQIFHQHLNYFSFFSLIVFLEKLGCELLDYTINASLWGSILIAFKKSKNVSKLKSKGKTIAMSEILSRYELFKQNMRVTSQRLAYLENEMVYGYGAALMLPVLCYHLKNDLSCLQCILDDDKRKEGLFYINLPVRIRTKEHIENFENSVIVLTALASMNNVRTILPKIFELKPKQVIVPLNTL